MAWGIGLTIGGEGGIRTHGTLAGTTVFETATFGRSVTSPVCEACGRIIPYPTGSPTHFEAVVQFRVGDVGQAAGF